MTVSRGQTVPLETHGEDSNRCRSYVLAQESIDIIDELRQEVRAAHNKFHWETVAAKPPHPDLYLEDVPRLSAEKVTTLSHGYTPSLPQVRGFAMKQLDRVRTSFEGDQKQLHLLFVKLVRLPNESPDSPGTVGNGNVFHGSGKPPELNGTKYPFVVLSAACDPTTRV